MGDGFIFIGLILNISLVFHVSKINSHLVFLIIRHFFSFINDSNDVLSFLSSPRNVRHVLINSGARTLLFYRVFQSIFLACCDFKVKFRYIIANNF